MAKGDRIFIDFISPESGILLAHSTRSKNKKIADFKPLRKYDKKLRKHVVAKLKDTSKGSKGNAKSKGSK